MGETTMDASAAAPVPFGTGAIRFDAEALYRALVEHIPAVIYLDPVAEDGQSLYVSPYVQELLGVTPEQWLADRYCWGRHIHPDDLYWVWDDYQQAMAQGRPLDRQYRMIHTDGTVKWVLEQAFPIPGPDGATEFVQGFLFDVTDRNTEELAFLAYHDKLTGLPNRQLLEEMLGLSLARAKRHGTGAALLFLDLDNFKLVNDMLGHQAGDRLLGAIAERLRPCMREVDIFARRSGDEFLVLLSDVEGGGEGGRDRLAAVAESVARRIVEALEEPFDLQDHSFTASASVGISLFPHDAGDGAAMLKHADIAMYESKRARPGGWTVYSGPTSGSAVSAQGSERAALVERVRRAVRIRAWELRWLPVVGLADGRLAGVEALIRWREPNGGLLPPGEFIPIAEEMGLIEAIGDWVLEELCRQDQMWRAAGLEVDLAFNLSPRQLWSTQLSDMLLAHLRAADIAPQRVTVEISEPAAMADPDRAQKVMYELRAWGLRLALDDFGTGLASLARLNVLPADVLKIDRAFVRGLESDPEQARLVRSMVDVARNLGMVPLAIGVETEAEAAFLRELGVPLAQGFLFSPPMPGELVPSLARGVGTHT
jgi:diguanylate cyclase (GGDEF)-like protein/PAS domain S-box-containing protein